jgi:hypothetical protein
LRRSQFASFGEKRFAFGDAVLGEEPLAVFGEGDGEPERHPDFAEGHGSSSESLLCLQALAVLGGEAGAKAGGVRP